MLTMLPATDSRLKPWLGLRARLALCFFSPSLLALAFVAARLALSSADVDDKVDDAKARLWASCRGAEHAATTAASMPRIMASNFNQATARAVTDTVQGLGRVLLLSIEGLENLLVFLVDMYRSLFLCVVELVVRGSLSLLISAVQIISDAVHAAAQGIQETIQASITSINAILKTSVSAVNDIAALFGRSVTAPQIAQPDLSALSDIKIPNTFESALSSINSSLPTLTDLKTKMNSVIMTPFEELRREINSTITGFNFNTSALPVPEQHIVTFCDRSLNTTAIDELGSSLKHTTRIGLTLLGLLALLLLVFCAIREWWSWKSLHKHVEYTRDAYLSSIEGQEPSSRTTHVSMLDKSSLFALMQLASHPLVARIAFAAARHLVITSPQSMTHLRWWLAWVSHPIALAVLAMGLFGLLTIQAQLKAVTAIQKEYAHRFDGMLDDTANGLQDSINVYFDGASTDFANKSNEVIVAAQNELNGGLFTWVNTTTSTMNNTLNEFMDGIANALNETFLQTPLQPLYQPVQTFIDCILGQKVSAVEKALTWIQSNAHVSFPMVPQDILMLDGNRTKELMEPVRQAALGSENASAVNDGILQRMTSSYVNGLKKERLFYGLLLVSYLLLVLVGLVIVFYSAAVPSKREFEDRQTRKKQISNPIFHLEKDVSTDHQREIPPQSTPTREYCPARPRQAAPDDHIARITAAQDDNTGSKPSEGYLFDELISALLAGSRPDHVNATRSNEKTVKGRESVPSKGEGLSNKIRERFRWTLSLSMWLKGESVKTARFVQRSKSEKNTDAKNEPLRQFPSFAKLKEWLRQIFRRYVKTTSVSSLKSAIHPLPAPAPAPVEMESDYHTPAVRSASSKGKRADLHIDTERASSFCLSGAKSSAVKLNVISTPSPRSSRKEHRAPAFPNLERLGKRGRVAETNREESRAESAFHSSPQTCTPTGSASSLQPHLPIYSSWATRSCTPVNYQPWPYHPPAVIRSYRHGMADPSHSSVATASEVIPAEEEDTLY